MFYARKAIAALESKRHLFAEAEQSRQEDLRGLSDVLEILAGLSRSEVELSLQRLPRPGALPTADHDRYRRLVLPFGVTWASHRQARRWALRVLRNVPTFVVDGSQIPPTHDISIPVAVVQVGCFENPHQGSAPYTKDVDVEVLTPAELAADYEEGGLFPHWRVNWQRFKMEIERLVSYMGSHAGVVPPPLCFFDGSLVVSFAQHMGAEHQRLYTDAVAGLLNASEQTRVPVVAYVDASYANDLVAMLSHLGGLHLTSRISDASLLRPRMKWGDRTQVYICARDDAVLDRYYERVCFVYLKTTADNPPARVEFPRWIYEADEQERVLDLVRAECIVGTGYPYPLETADAVAVLTMPDRERFYRILQEFTEREGLPLRFPRKAVSKGRRRT